MPERSNEAWLADLRHPTRRDVALGDLRTILVRGLRSAIGRRSHVREADIEDFVQDALVKITGALDTFRGESHFTTWAHKIAVRMALSELRRRRWQDRSLEEMTSKDNGDDTAGSILIPLTFADSGAGPEQQAIQSALLGTLRRAIDEGLTERQRQALIAVRIHGVPLEEVARRMDTNRNALYKLLHDARKTLQKTLLEQGISAGEILATFE